MVIALIFTFSSNVFAATSNDDSNQLKQVQDNKNQLQGTIQGLDAQINGVLTKVDNNKKDMNKIASDIQNTQVKLDNTNRKLSMEQVLLNKRMKAMYTDGNSSYLEVLLGSHSISDFISKMDITAKIIQYDNNIINNVKQHQSVVTLQRKNLDAENNSLQALKSDNQSSLVKLSSDINKQKTLLSNANDKEKQLIEAQRQKELAQAAAAAAQKAQEVAAQNAKNAATKNTVLLAAPSSPSSATPSPTISPGPTGPGPTVYTMEATSYSTYGYTSTGTTTHRDPAGYSTIAVDPTVITPGTKVYVSGYGYAVAEDTGGLIHGNIIDVYLPTEAEASAWGRRTVTVTIVK